MAITDKEQGVWGLDQVYNKINQGGIWSYDGLIKFMAAGQNNRGQLGQNESPSTRTGYSSPVQVPGTDWVLNHYGSGETFLAKKTDGTLWGIGNDEKGQLGLNSVKDGYSSPVQIPGTTWNFMFVSSGSGIQGTKTDGTFWSWGTTAWGQSGHNVSHPGNGGYSSPVQLPGSWATGENKHTKFASMATAIKADGTLWAWGYGADGRLGQGNNTPRSSPVQIPGTTWSNVVLGNSSEFGGAIKTDGTLWMWGKGAWGNLGLNSTSDKNSPTQVPGTTWDRAAVGTLNVYAFKTDGTLWTWGYNGYGQLGLNNTTSLSSPIQIPGTTWSEYAPYQAGVGVSMLKSDNTLWSWGRNDQGNLAHNDRTDRSSPTQIPGSWTEVAPTMNGFWAKIQA
jgi:alpha-tubulin suppressor-like RCC1 family protein